MADKGREFTVFHLVAILLDTAAFIFVIILEIILRLVAYVLAFLGLLNLPGFSSDANRRKVV